MSIGKRFISFISRNWAAVSPVGKKLLISVDPLRWLLSSIVDLFVRDRNSLQTVVSGNLSGYKIYVNLKHEKRYWLGAYEPELQWAIGNLSLEDWVIYDVGANIGFSTLLLAQAVGAGGKVIAFEPFPENVERLQKNIDLNDMAHKVQVIQRAVMHKNIKVPFLTYERDSMGHVDEVSREPDLLQGKINVEGETLDHFVFQGENPVPDFLKIDVEGAEALVLQGATRLLAEVRPMMIIELHNPEAAGEVWQIMSSSGYSFFRLEPGFPEAEVQSSFVKAVRVLAKVGAQ
jgi:FkbM family methyltransferase